MQSDAESIQRIFVWKIVLPTIRFLITTMAPDVLELLKRRLARLRVEHESCLVFQDSEVLRTIDVARKATISTAYEKLIQDTTTLTEYCHQVRDEVLIVAGETSTELSANAQVLIRSVVTAQFDPDIYIKRFDGFGEAIMRHFCRRGMSIDLSMYRLDLYRARHHAGTANSITRFLSSLNDGIELLIQRKRFETAERHTQTEKHQHWTTYWGFWIAVVGTTAGVGGAYRAFVPAPASNSMPSAPDANPTKYLPGLPATTSSSSTTSDTTRTPQPPKNFASSGSNAK